MELRLATFNLENLGVRPREEAPKASARLAKHVEVLRGVLRRLDADALALQEVLEPVLLDPLLAGLGYEHRVLCEPGTSPLRVAVVSRHPLRAPESVAGAVDFSVTDRKTGLELTVRGPFSRAALQVVWEAPGLETTLIAVHWKSKIPSPTPSRREAPSEPWGSFGDVAEGRLLTEAKRLAQALEVRRQVDRILSRSPETRLAVLGDFNDTLDSEGLRIVTGDTRACLSPSLSGGELIPCERAVPGDLRYTQLYRGRREMLDHILISPALLPHFAGAQILNEVLREADDGPSDDVYDAGSDHAAFRVSFRA